MKINGLSLLLLLLAAVLVGTYGHFSDHDKVVGVLDDNTIELGKGRIVHLIGVDPVADPVGITPATGASHTPEATDAAAEAEMEIDSPYLDAITSKAMDQKVKLHFPSNYNGDMPTPDLFAYVELEDGTDLGAWIIEQGYARADGQHQYDQAASYKSIESAAMDAHMGMWTPVEPDTMDVME